MGGQNRILSKRFWSDQWAAVQVQRVANQWVAWWGRFLQTSLKTKFFPPAIMECLPFSSELKLRKKWSPTLSAKDSICHKSFKTVFYAAWHNGDPLRSLSSPRINSKYKYDIIYTGCTLEFSSRYAISRYILSPRKWDHRILCLPLYSRTLH
jgi:hypothetical protein